MIDITVITNIKKAQDYFSRTNNKADIEKIYYIIRNYYEKPMIIKLLKDFRPDFSVEEVNEIYNHTTEIFNNDKYNTRIEAIIKNKLNDYYLYNNVLNIDGFIKFRLNSYISILVDIISVCAEEYVIEKEYNEFIALLQKYVMLQESVFDRIEVLLLKDCFVVYDIDGNNITDYCIKTYLIDDLIKIARTEDLLLNLLIVTAPKEIIIYNANNDTNKDFLKTVKKIFNKSILIINSNQTDFL